jgi:hypothetical protein
VRSQNYSTQRQKEAKTIPLLHAVLLPPNTFLFNDFTFFSCKRFKRLVCHPNGRMQTECVGASKWENFLDVERKSTMSRKKTAQQEASQLATFTRH